MGKRLLGGLLVVLGISVVYFVIIKKMSLADIVTAITGFFKPAAATPTQTGGTLGGTATNPPSTVKPTIKPV